jgi:hypothetical protein
MSGNILRKCITIYRGNEEEHCTILAHHEDHNISHCLRHDAQIPFLSDTHHGLLCSQRPRLERSFPTSMARLLVSFLMSTLISILQLTALD